MLWVVPRSSVIHWAHSLCQVFLVLEAILNCSHPAAGIRYTQLSGLLVGALLFVARRMIPLFPIKNEQTKHLD